MDPGLGLDARPGRWISTPASHSHDRLSEADFVDNKSAAEVFVRAHQRVRCATTWSRAAIQGITSGRRGVHIPRIRRSPVASLAWAGCRSAEPLSRAASPLASIVGRACLMLPPGIDFAPALFGVSLRGDRHTHLSPSGSRADRTIARVRAWSPTRALAWCLHSGLHTRWRRWVVDSGAHWSPWLDIDQVERCASEDGVIPWPPVTSPFLLHVGIDRNPAWRHVSHANLLTTSALVPVGPYWPESCRFRGCPYNHDMGCHGNAGARTGVCPTIRWRPRRSSSAVPLVQAIPVRRHASGADRLAYDPRPLR